MGRAVSMRSSLPLCPRWLRFQWKNTPPASYFAAEVKAILSKERFRNGVGNKVH